MSRRYQLPKPEPRPCPRCEAVHPSKNSEHCRVFIDMVQRGVSDRDLGADCQRWPRLHVRERQSRS